MYGCARVVAPPPPGWPPPQRRSNHRRTCPGISRQDVDWGAGEGAARPPGASFIVVHARPAQGGRQRLFFIVVHA